jgi:hypothetical protein
MFSDTVKTTRQLIVFNNSTLSFGITMHTDPDRTTGEVADISASSRHDSFHNEIPSIGCRVIGVVGVSSRQCVEMSLRPVVTPPSCHSAQLSLRPFFWVWLGPELFRDFGIEWHACIWPETPAWRPDATRPEIFGMSSLGTHDPTRFSSLA